LGLGTFCERTRWSLFDFVIGAVGNIGNKLWFPVLIINQISEVFKMGYKGGVRYRVAKGRLIKLTVFGAAGWFLAMAGLLLLGFGVLSLAAATCLGLVGIPIIFVVAASRCVTPHRPLIKSSYQEVGSAGAMKLRWSDMADPKTNFANRWVMYEDLGNWLNQHNWAGKRVVEFGASNKLLCRFMAGAEHIVLAYPEYDIQNLAKVDDNQFDVAILDQVLEHVGAPERGLTEVHRILKPGGVAIITLPFLVPVHMDRDYGDYYRWTPQGVETSLKRCGFDAQVRMWGNLKAAKLLLEDMYMFAEEAFKRGLKLSLKECDERFPVSVWAVAAVRK
jgi:SAM-dependent methyltransferase